MMMMMNGGGTGNIVGVHRYVLADSQPLARLDRRVWVDVEYCQGQRKAHEATPENVFYGSLPVKLTDFLLKRHVLADKIRYNYSEDALIVHALKPDKRGGTVVRVKNTGPYSFYNTDFVYLGPPMEHPDVSNGVELDGKLYFTPTLMPEREFKRLLCGESYRFLAGRGTGPRVRDANGLDSYMNWIVGGEGENWDRSLDGFVPAEAKVIDKFTALEAEFARKSAFLRGGNQPADARCIQSRLLLKEFEEISNRMALLLAQACCDSTSEDGGPQNAPLFWQLPCMRSLFGNYPKPVGKVVFSYGGSGDDYYYSSSSARLAAIAPGQDMAVELDWN